MAASDVEHPAYYCGSIECINAMMVSQGKHAVADFCACNCFKYLWRWREKNGVEDLQKAKWYLDYLIELLTNKD